MSDSTSAFLVTQVYRIPFLLIYVVALVVAIRRLGTMGDAALLAAIGFGFLTAGWVLTTVFMHIQYTETARGTSMQEVAHFAAIFVPAAQLSSLIGTALVAMAVFRRGARA